MRRAWRNKVVVIVGASSGIGRATALLLAKKGAHLVLAARREEPLEELARECTDAGASCHVMSIDIADATAARALADEAVRAFCWRVDCWRWHPACASPGHATAWAGAWRSRSASEGNPSCVRHSKVTAG